MKQLETSLLYSADLETIRSYHGCVDRIYNSSPRVTDWHHEALPINKRMLYSFSCILWGASALIIHFYLEIPCINVCHFESNRRHSDVVVTSLNDEIT